jgi:hypothetical protein
MPPDACPALRSWVEIGSVEFATAVANTKKTRHVRKGTGTERKFSETLLVERNETLGEYRFRVASVCLYAKRLEKKTLSSHRFVRTILLIAPVLVLEGSMVADPIYDHDRFEVDRLSIDCGAFS